MVLIAMMPKEIFATKTVTDMQRVRWFVSLGSVSVLKNWLMCCGLCNICICIYSEMSEDEGEAFVYRIYYDIIK